MCMANNFSDRGPYKYFPRLRKNYDKTQVLMADFRVIIHTKDL
jgi:hypothetical protein